jgi:putative intracellular protease/amidase
MIWLAVLTWFRTNPRNVFLIAGLVALLLAAGGLYLKGRQDAHARDEARRKIAVAAAVKADTKADAKSTEALARDALAIDAKQKELEDAVAKIPDTTPDAVAVAAGCVELQRNGIRTSDLPACQPAR